MRLHVRTPIVTDPDYPRLSTLSTGLRCRCPRCGKGPLLKGFLTIREACPACGLDYGFAEPADGPAFFAMSRSASSAWCCSCGSSSPSTRRSGCIWSSPCRCWCSAVSGVLRPFKGWLVSEQYVHKAAPPECESIGGHGEGSKWR